MFLVLFIYEANGSPCLEIERLKYIIRFFWNPLDNLLDIEFNQNIYPYIFTPFYLSTLLYSYLVVFPPLHTLAFLFPSVSLSDALEWR